MREDQAAVGIVDVLVFRVSDPQSSSFVPLDKDVELAVLGQRGAIENGVCSAERFD